MPSTTILSGLNPALIEKIERLLKAMEVLGHPMKVTQGLRTVEQQQALYAQGRTRPGKIVTQLDGITKKSNHQSGRAVDCVFVTPTGISWEGPWELYGLAAESLGLKWGGRWKTLVDRPHVEL